MYQGGRHGGRSETGRLERLELERGAQPEAGDATDGGKPHKGRRKGGSVGSRQKLADAMTKGMLL